MRFFEENRKARQEMRELRKSQEEQDQTRPPGERPWWLPQSSWGGPAPVYAHEYENPQEALDDLARGFDKREGRGKTTQSRMTEEGLVVELELKPGWAQEYIRDRLTEDLTRETAEGKLPVFIEPPTPPEPFDNVGKALDWMRKK